LMCEVIMAAASTIDALVFQLRDGFDAIKDASALRRLSELSDQQLPEVCQRVLNFEPNIAAPWTPEEAAALTVIWRSLK
jgi:hypothetical protein